MHGNALLSDQQRVLHVAIAVGVLFPVFFQFGGGIYRSPDVILYDSGGSIMDVPLPASLVVVFFGGALLGGYRRAGTAFGLMLLLLAGMGLTTIVAGASNGFESRKLLLLIQFLVPIGALVAGQLYGSRDDVLRQCASAFLAVITAIVPLQMGISLHRQLIWHDLWLFTIYQHRQFVPIVFVGAYLFAAFVLLENRRYRPWVVALAPIMGAYAAASYAVLAIAFLAAGLSVLVLARARSAAAYLSMVLAVVGAAAFLYHDSGSTSFQAKYGAFRSMQPESAPEQSRGAPGSIEQAELAPSRVPLNVRPRLADWALYGSGILESPWTASFGHSKPFDRAVSTSAHNYYLDFVYNFGLVALLPLLWLIAYTAILLWRVRGTLRDDLPLLGLGIVVGFLVLIDNNFKVTFRQPYPGLFGFFMWGLLLSRLAASRRET